MLDANLRTGLIGAVVGLFALPLVVFHAAFGVLGVVGGLVAIWVSPFSDDRHRWAPVPFGCAAFIGGAVLFASHSGLVELITDIVRS